MKYSGEAKVALGRGEDSGGRRRLRTVDRVGGRSGSGGEGVLRSGEEDLGEEIAPGGGGCLLCLRSGEEENRE